MNTMDPTQQTVQQPLPTAYVYAAPIHRANFTTNRSLTKYILLGIITLGIYPIYVAARAGEDLNAVASRYDNRRTMNYWLVALLLGWLTLGIMHLVWWHTTSDRIGNEQVRRGQQRTISSADYWLWAVLGAFIIVGPFVFMHKWLHAMNDLCADFNERG